MVAVLLGWLATLDALHCPFLFAPKGNSKWCLTSLLLLWI
jgi:hypothetical protein